MIAPTIIIGLGGIGSDICCRVSKLVKDEGQRRRIRFVCIDTDVNDLNQRKAEDPEVITIQTSAPYLISEYMAHNKNARENWFPVHNLLMGKVPTEGAGQVRAISRLAFEEAVKEGRVKALEKAIEELYFLDGSAAPQAIRVMIVSTLAGGTGSGIVLPVAMYVRNFLQTRFRRNAAIIRGFFMLPEILFGNKSPEECNSLCCNAYAAVRELDAFMRRGDGALEGPKYKNMVLEFPDSVSGDYVDYKVSPFNFCFLYDKRNTDDLQLKSFDDYKEHAANTIYTQAISGIASRSNSNEDNTIKPLIKTNGRNRFCGAGSSLLKYPRDSVLRYIADQWCIQAMDEDWLKIDKEYQIYKAEQKILKKKNPSLKEQSLEEFYILKIKAADKGSFEEQIKAMCYKEQNIDGDILEECKVDIFMRNLRMYISHQIQNDASVIMAKDEYDQQKAEVENNPKDSDIKDMYKTLVQKANDYEAAVRNAAKNLGRVLALQLFEDGKDHTSDTADYRMEFYMRDDNDKFIHPNAARFFIYMLIERLKEGLKNSDDQIKRTESALELLFDDPKTIEVEDGQDFIENSRIGKKRLLVFSMDGKDRAVIISRLETQYEDSNMLAISMCQKLIFETALRCLQSMSEAYEAFYSNFEQYLKDVQKEVTEIEHRYVNGEGKATRYVCASKNCLHKILQNMPFKGDNSGANGVLSAAIYQEMKKYAVMGKKPNASFYFQNLFEQQIMKFWEEEVLHVHEKEINMDIITALENEADYEAGENLTDEQKQRKVALVLKEAERLAAPFIEDTMGELHHPFTICAYNQCILGDPDSKRNAFVKSAINDELGGQVDDNVSPYELMVYKAIYNLSAGDFQRFRAPAKPGKVGGTYYNAYINTIRELGPDTTENMVLTPHLDRHWHLTKYMPDLDDFNQSILENDIYTAFAWGMISGKIEQSVIEDPLSEGNILYKPATRDGERFIVSNGSVCDELYEVIDALAINPPQVQMILDDMRETMRKEKVHRYMLSESRLMNCMNWVNQENALGDTADSEDMALFSTPFRFKIKQFVPGQRPSIFDLIYWVKESTPAEDVTEEEIYLIVDNMIAMLETYVGQFVDPKEKYKRCFMILMDQFQLFLSNLKDPLIKRPKNRIKDKCVNIIRNRLDERIGKAYDIPYTEPMRTLYEQELEV